MTLAFKSGDALLASVDLDTLTQAIPAVTLHDCPACEQKSMLAQDGNAWFVVGRNASCPICNRTWRLPSESEADDLRTKGEK